MWRKAMLGFAALSLLAYGAPGPKDEKVKSPIIGHWRLLSTDGKNQPEGSSVIETFGDDGICTRATRVGDKETEDRERFAIIPGTEPAQIDFIFQPTDAKVRPTKIEGIFKIDGNTLTICYSTSEMQGNRPKEFKLVRSTTVYVYERATAKE